MARYAYIDTSWLIRFSFEDRGKRDYKSLKKWTCLFSSDLLIAEALSYASREGIQQEAVVRQFEAITFVIPDRSLRPEIERVLKAGYARGADLWHLACACYLEPDPNELCFLTYDHRQLQLARSIGFPLK